MVPHLLFFHVAGGGFAAELRARGCIVGGADLELRLERWMDCRQAPQPALVADAGGRSGLAPNRAGRRRRAAPGTALEIGARAYCLKHSQTLIVLRNSQVVVAAPVERCGRIKLPN